MSDALRDAVIRGSTIAPQWDEATYQALHLLDRLESQNQALQERAEKAEALLSLVRFDPAKGVYPDTPGWRLIQERDALQERAEKAEALVRDIAEVCERTGGEFWAGSEPDIADRMDRLALFPHPGD